MLDRVLALVAFLFFGGFLGVIIFSVSHPMLIVVAGMGIAFVGWDFFSQLFLRRRRY